MMTPSVHFMRSFNHALALLTAGCLTAFFWCFFRLPDSNLLIVTNAFQLTAVLYDVPDWRDRLKLAAFSTGAAAVLQFIIGMTARGKFLTLILPGITMYLILVYLKNRKCAATALIIGSLGVTAQPGFMPSVSRAFDLGCSVATIMAATALVGIVHVRSDFSPIFPGGFTRTQALRVSCMMLLGLYLYKTTKMPEGIWMMLTISMVYSGASAGRAGYPMAVQRIAATPFGMLFCFLFLGCITYFYAPALYIFPLIGGFGFFLLYYTGSYFLFSILFVMIFSVYADLAAGTYQPFQIFQLSVTRTIATTIGAVILIVFEKFFLPDPGEISVMVQHSPEKVKT